MLTGAKQTRVETAIEGVNKKTLHDKIFIKVFMANSLRGDSSHYFDTFEIPIQRWTTELDALLYVKSYQDSSIGILYSCRMASCRSCGMKINGTRRLACYTKISEWLVAVVVIQSHVNHVQTFHIYEIL
jgi:succinate dehydrogenase / fumarate reductase iron-sulfur subunit